MSITASTGVIPSLGTWNKEVSAYWVGRQSSLPVIELKDNITNRNICLAIAKEKQDEYIMTYNIISWLNIKLILKVTCTIRARNIFYFEVLIPTSMQ